MFGSAYLSDLPAHPGSQNYELHHSEICSLGLLNVEESLSRFQKLDKFRCFVFLCGLLCGYSCLTFPLLFVRRATGPEAFWDVSVGQVLEDPLGEGQSLNLVGGD